VSTGDFGTDEILVKAGCKSRDERYEKMIKDHFRAKIRVAPEVRIVDPEEIISLGSAEMNRKPITFIDKRS
jgi:phenylacetate-CoA ligase